MLAKLIPSELLDYFEYDEQSKSGLVFKNNMYDKNGKLRFKKKVLKLVQLLEQMGD